MTLAELASEVYSNKVFSFVINDATWIVATSEAYVKGMREFYHLEKEQMQKQPPEITGRIMNLQSLKRAFMSMSSELSDKEVIIRDESDPKDSGRFIRNVTRIDYDEYRDAIVIVANTRKKK